MRRDRHHGEHRQPHRSPQHPPRSRIQRRASHHRKVHPPPSRGRQHCLSSLLRRVDSERHKILHRRSPHYPPHSRRPATRHPLGLRSSFLHHLESGHRRRLARQSQPDHHLPRTDGRRL